MWALLGAMEIEIKEFLKRLEEKTETGEGDFRFFRGRIAGREVLVGKTGVGKVLAALTTQKIIDTYKPEAILFTGLAGSLKKEMDVGDTLIAQDCVQWDLDARVFGFKRGTIPYTRRRYISGDAKLLEAASSYVPKTGSLHFGRIVTGDTFIKNSETEEYSFLRKELDGWAVEMEGAGVALTAAVNSIPCLLIRIISDKADGKAPLSFLKFVAKASKLGYDAAVHIMEKS